MLKFSDANAKTKQLSKVAMLSQQYLDNGRKIVSLDISSGWSCPFANDCLSKVHIINSKRKIKDGPKTKFRCFSASQEALFPPVYEARKHNYDLLRSTNFVGMSKMISEAIPKKTGIIRIHVGGDFFNQDYFDSWLAVAKSHPHILFYAYTKSLTYWIKRRANRDIPKNFILTASRGGRLDHLIKPKRLREAIVVFSENEANRLNLDIDHDDSHAANPAIKKQNFALLIHGIQPKGSEASQALSALKRKGSYKR